jgi:hypothetical protein
MAEAYLLHLLNFVKSSLALTLRSYHRSTHTCLEEIPTWATCKYSPSHKLGGREEVFGLAHPDSPTLATISAASAVAAS